MPQERPTIIAKSYKHLRNLVVQEMNNHGTGCDLNHIDVTRVKNMESLFEDSNFNGDISRWDVSRVTNMSRMFTWSPFKGDLSNWDVSKVKTMEGMFVRSKFNGHISGWDVSNVTDMNYMFAASAFTGDIAEWNVGKVTNFSQMFSLSPFDGDLSRWDVSSGRNFVAMFSHGEFNGDIARWDMRNARFIDFMFEKSAFTKDVAGWTLHDDAEPGSVFESNKKGLRKQGMSDWVIAHYALDGIKHLDPDWQAALEAYKSTESLFPVRERVRGGMGLEAKAMGISGIAARVRGFYVPGVVPDATAPAQGMSLG